MWKGSFGCEFFKWANVCRGIGLWEEVGLYEYFSEQRLPVGIRQCINYFSPNAESVLATTGASLLVELICVAAQPFAGWMSEGRLHEEYQRTMDDLEHGYQISTDSSMCKNPGRERGNMPVLHIPDVGELRFCTGGEQCQRFQKDDQGKKAFHDDAYQHA